ncbi:uncharacterized protein [Notamacropus eugenii]|uniref:uncharacterized protein n=1 Tax=Notamacropus eugenii TaxID=9315 RepID=UPI003B671FBA
MAPPTGPAGAPAHIARLGLRSRSSPEQPPWPPPPPPDAAPRRPDGPLPLPRLHWPRLGATGEPTNGGLRWRRGGGACPGKRRGGAPADSLGGKAGSARARSSLGPAPLPGAPARGGLASAWLRRDPREVARPAPALRGLRWPGVRGIPEVLPGEPRGGVTVAPASPWGAEESARSWGRVGNREYLVEGRVARGTAADHGLAGACVAVGLPPVSEAEKRGPESPAEERRRRNPGVSSSDIGVTGGVLKDTHGRQRPTGDLSTAGVGKESRSSLQQPGSEVWAPCPLAPHPWQLGALEDRHCRGSAGCWPAEPRQCCPPPPPAGPPPPRTASGSPSLSACDHGRNPRADPSWAFPSCWHMPSRWWAPADCEPAAPQEKAFLPGQPAEGLVSSPTSAGGDHGSSRRICRSHGDETVQEDSLRARPHLARVWAMRMGSDRGSPGG